MARTGSWSINLTIHSEADAAATFTNMPTADTFLFSSHRHIQLVHVDGLTQVRFKVNKQSTAGSAGSKLVLRFSGSFSTSASSYQDIGVTEVSVPIDSQNTYLDSDWIDLNPEVFMYGGDIFVAVIGSGGNGTLDPTFGSISVAFQ